MLKSNARWLFPATESGESEQLDVKQNLSPIITQLLNQRGITNKDEVKQFLSPQLSNLHTPALLESMDKAVSRVDQAITDQEKILVFGDYDADGVSSTTLMLDVLSELGAACNYYIPNRFTEGYGPNKEAFQWCLEAGYSLVITVDTGIAAHEELQYAYDSGLDVIVTDHHEIQDEVPESFALIHPKWSPDYPFKELAGVGVAFKFAEALLGYFPDHLLDLAALGTIADMVPLLDENRLLAFYGLQALNTTTRPGLKALKNVYDIDHSLDEETVGFKLAPALNAVGRLQSADLAVKLLTAADEEEAMSLAEDVKLLNEKRKDIVQDIVQEAEKMVDSEERNVIVVAYPDWNAGVLGIVASRLVRKFNRPAIVLSIDEATQTAKGSARSIPAFDMFENGMSVRELFTHFGGHAQAAGMTLPVDNIDVLRLRLGECVKNQLGPDDFKPVIPISHTLDVTQADEQLINDLSKLAPFGMGNPKPVFHMKAEPTGIRQIGRLQNHLKMQFKDADHIVDAIGFDLGNYFWHIAPKSSVSVVGELGINEWNGHKKVQMTIQDLCVDEWQLFDHRGAFNYKLVERFTDTKTVAVVGDNPGPEYAHLTQIVYNQAHDRIPSDIDTLIIIDLPPDLNALASIINDVNPWQIHVCFYVGDSLYLKPFPSREDFKWFYGLIVKQGIINLHQELKPIMDAKSWSKDQVVFMAQVFRELAFIDIDKGMIKKNSNPVKKDLNESSVYTNRLNKREIEKTLYYSQYDQLKAWFAECMKQGQPAREAVTNGL